MQLFFPSSVSWMCVNLKQSYLIQNTCNKMNRIFLLLFLLAFGVIGKAQSFQTTKTFQTDYARQAIAIDDNYFYAIDSYEIGKYDKKTGKLIKTWKESEDGHVKHLNSGKVIDGKLYCAHSDYPAVPRHSTIEIWNTETMGHIGKHDFGVYDGAANIIVGDTQYWWVLFAHYTGAKAEPDRTSYDTRLDKFDKDWNRLASYTFPKEVIDVAQPKSISGGDWGADGYLYCTGHDNAEVYQLKLPESGTVLEYIQTIPVECEGQGISFDNEGNLWTIKRKSKEVVVSKIVR